MVATVWTVGHSAHEPESFVHLLRRHRINAIADVRSEPYSRHAPQFCKEAFTDLLRRSDIHYVFLGRELGARSDDETVFTDDRVDFDKLAQSRTFLAGLERLRAGAARHRIALVCAEHDPLHCHRAILVSRHLCGPALEVRHVHQDGRLETHAQLERRLLDHYGLGEGDLFTPFETQLESAYEEQGRRMAWRRPDSGRGV
ncbi:MAG: DUF488 domain-containing protein [Planctomycetota bacterium]|nr:DUF488 domain-containing protein [Planctomycetota bacterium]